MCAIFGMKTGKTQQFSLLGELLQSRIQVIAAAAGIRRTGPAARRLLSFGWRLRRHCGWPEAINRNVWERWNISLT